MVLNCRCDCGCGHCCYAHWDRCYLE